MIHVADAPDEGVRRVEGIVEQDRVHTLAQDQVLRKEEGKRVQVGVVADGVHHIQPAPVQENLDLALEIDVIDPVDEKRVPRRALKRVAHHPGVALVAAGNVGQVSMEALGGQGNQVYDSNRSHGPHIVRPGSIPPEGQGVQADWVQKVRRNPDRAE